MNTPFAQGTHGTALDFLILVFPVWDVSMTLSPLWLVGYSLRITSLEFCLCLTRWQILRLTTA